MTRTVLITGAGGFVGSHLAAGFLDMGDTVLALDSHFDLATRRRLQGARLVEADLAADVVLDVGGLDVVIHAAAITTSPEDLGLTSAQHIAANLDLVESCLAIARSHGAQDFVFLSSSGVFAATDGDEVHLESTAPTASLPYARAKRAGEDAATAASDADLRAISVRLGPIYGPCEVPRATRTTVSQVRRWLDRVTAGEPIIVDMPSERRDWTFAPDLPHALDALLCLEPRVTGVVHLTSAQIVSNLELAQAIAALATGARILVAPSGAAPRKPMASDRIAPGLLPAWTPLATGLARTLGEVAA